MNKCNMCPRKCNIDRTSSSGFCGVHNKIIIRKVMLHNYEEPILTSNTDKGSGTIFFAGCNLGCVYCQNYDVSHSNKGKEISVNELVDIFKLLEQSGAGNIDLVSPTHFAEQIIEALKIYKPKVPVIWNTGGYETPETISKLEGLIDIYLTDFKYANNNYGLKYSKANNYVEKATATTLQMKKNQPVDIIENGLMKKGVIIRHLILPTHTNDSVNCLKFICENLGKDSIVSIMSQYEPMYDAKNYTEINRKITPLEYKRVVNYAINNEMTNCFTQDLSSANSKFTPKF